MKKAEVKRKLGPLAVCKENPRYFADGSGKPVYLTGLHTWNSLIDLSENGVEMPFDFPEYLDLLQAYNHNFIRLWTMESIKVVAGNKETLRGPLPWLRTGPGVAVDGRPKFDLSQFDPDYFMRMRERIIAAGDRGVYVSVMLFEGWFLQFIEAPWDLAGHPFHSENNINGIDIDPDKKGKGLKCHTLEIPAVTTIQEAYVRKVLETVNDLDNVLYEIANESGFHYSKEWQYHFIKFVHETEKKMPNQHPVGMTGYGPSDNSVMYASAAEWISPGGIKPWWARGENDPLKINPHATDGTKVEIMDTDHIWGLGGDRSWAWKCFLRGYNPIFMDNYKVKDFPGHPEEGKFYAIDKRPKGGKEPVLDHRYETVRKNLGYTRRYAQRINLAKATPQSDLALSGFCLAHPGHMYLAYLPKGGKTAVDLSAGKGIFSLEWLNPANGKTLAGKTVKGGDIRHFQPPFRGDAVLFLQKKL